MLWPIILPFQITACACLVAIGAAWWFAPHWKYPPLRTALAAVLLAGLLFVPSCTGVKYLVDHVRFGVFKHVDFAAVNDWRVERYLPGAATDITLEKPSHGNGFRAKFAISKPALETWLDDVWDKWHDRSRVTRQEAQGVVSTPRFDDLGWPPLQDALAYEGPREDDWGGFTVWYSEADGIAYEDAAYW